MMTKHKQCFYLIPLELFIIKTITTTKTNMMENAKKNTNLIPFELFSTLRNARRALASLLFSDYICIL